MSKPFVVVVMGSDSDLVIVEKTLDTLSDLEVDFEVKVTSAHRTPEQTSSYIKDAESRGAQVFIAAAGLAAHLAGAVSANTTKPVIGIPIETGPLNGLDALLSTVQMPGGCPVATVAIGSAGAKNAAILAAQMIALSDEALAERLLEEKKKMVDQVQKKDQQLAEKMKKK